VIGLERLFGVHSLVVIPMRHRRVGGMPRERIEHHYSEPEYESECERNHCVRSVVFRIEVGQPKK
jgi:hypothetical protein